VILGTPIAGTFAGTGGRLVPLRELRGGTAVLDGAELPVEQLETVLVIQAEPPTPGRAFPAPAAHGAPTSPALRPDVRAELREAVEQFAPEGWREVRLDASALGTRIEITAAVVTADGSHGWIPPQELVDRLQRTRAVEYLPESGTWTTARVTAAQGGELTFETTREQPRLTGEDPQAAFDELRYFPRAQAPDWLLTPAWEHYDRHRAGEPRGPVRMVQVFDGKGADGRPLAHRPVLPWAEKQLVVDYLGGGEIILSAGSTSEDEVDPQRPPEVPKQFHTDGTWVWPLAVAYYLHVHDIAPPRDFLDHVRRNAHRPPEVVAEHAAEEAKALVLGTDADQLDAERTENAIYLAAEAISRLGVSRRFYSFTEPLEGGWSMLREPDGWWAVFCVDEGVVSNKSRFPEPNSAAAHLIGCATLTRASMLREPDEPLADYECPIAPLGPDLPLSHYENRLLAVLPDGAEVDRFGEPDGNTVFVAGTTLPQRSAPPQQQPGEYRRYRVVGGLRAVSGVIKPDHGQVGGGTAYFLPKPVGDLVADGALAEL